MASTQTAYDTKNDSGNGLGFERYTIVWAGGTTTGDVIPTLSSGITQITKWGVTNLANANAVKVVKSFDLTNHKDKLTLTGTANDSFDVWVEGYSRGSF